MSSNRFDELFESELLVEALSLGCLADFKTYIQTIFYALNRKPFQFKPFHNTIISKLQDIADLMEQNPDITLPLKAGDKLVIYKPNIIRF